MFKRAEIPQPGAAVVKNFFPAFQRAKKISGHQFLQDQAPDAIVEEAIVAPIEWPEAAEKTGVVHCDDQHGQADDDERELAVRPGLTRTRAPINATAATNSKIPRAKFCRRTRHGGVKCIASVSGLIPTPKMRLPTSAPAMVRQLSPASGAKCWFSPSHNHLTTPAQFASGIGRWQADHLEPRHCDMPAIPTHPEAPVTLRAAHVGIAGPVIAELVDEPEVQPNRVGNCLGRVRVREYFGACQIPSAENAKVESGGPWLRQQPNCFGSHRFRRILRIERGRQMTIDVSRQNRVPAPGWQKDIVPFLNARRRQKCLPSAASAAIATPAIHARPRVRRSPLKMTIRSRAHSDRHHYEAVSRPVPRSGPDGPGGA